MDHPSGPDDDPALHLTLFGGAHLDRDEVPLPVPATGMRVLAYLALHGPAARTRAAGSLWPDSTEGHALACLRTAVWRLRTLDPHLLRCEQDRLWLSPSVRVDADSFVTAARRALGDGPLEVPDALALVTAGTGDLLAGWYDDWALAERERFRQLRMHVLERVAELLVECGRYAAALEVAYDAVAMEPLRESAHRAVMRVHLAEGNYVEALREFQAFRSLLAAELGIEPSPRLRAMLDPALVVPAARRPSGSGARDHSGAPGLTGA